MNGALLIVAGSIFFALAYITYGRYLYRLFDVDPEKVTPANTKNDGVDYVPTSLPVLFGHHFASIAGAGPIVGPVLAVYFGWLPVALWIVIGCIFVGAMHDFSALILSIRDEGRSIGHVIEGQLGYAGRQIFLLFCWAALILVVSVFALFVAKTFVKTPSAATASLLFIVMAPVFGWLVYKRGLPLGLGSLVFVPLLFFFIFVGVMYPLDLTLIDGVTEAKAKSIWLCVLMAYVFAASIMPVWLLLQPRDYLNSFLLYSMLLLGFVSILIVRPSFQMDAFCGWQAIDHAGGKGGLFPILFVTVACGACSGFHSLVASGTTAKQIRSKKDVLAIGYGSMLVEGVLALMALVSVAVLSQVDCFASIKELGPVGAFASGLAGFAESVHLPLDVGITFISLAISAFMLTTLDTAARLTRFTWQELFLPPGEGESSRTGLTGILANRYTATFIVVAIAGYMSLSGNAMQIWPVFGASNQLLAALTLLAITLVLVRKKKNYLVALIPMIFMMCVCMWALISLLLTNINSKNVNWGLVVSICFLIVMSVVLIFQAVISVNKLKKRTKKWQKNLHLY